MADFLREVHSNEPWRETADFRNAVIGMLREYLQNRPAHFGTPTPSEGFEKWKPISFVNERGSVIPWCGIVGVGEIVNSPQVNLNSFRSRAVLRTAAPAESLPFAVAIDSAPDGGVFQAVVSGHAVCKVSVTDADHQYAECVTNNYDYLASGLSGNARILAVDDLPAAAVGQTVHEGTGAPSGGLGSNGDYYKDTAAEQYYGPKAGGVWPSAVNYGIGICWAIVSLGSSDLPFGTISYGTTGGTTQPQDWTCPDRVFWVVVECWGAGGAGEHGVSPAGGGGGGAYAYSILPVVPGTTYKVRPGRATDTTVSPVVVAESSWFSLTGSVPTSSAEGVLAAPGEVASGTTGGAGGLSSACYGDVAYSGGSGGDAAGGVSGSGGGTAFDWNDADDGDNGWAGEPAPRGGDGSYRGASNGGFDENYSINGGGSNGDVGIGSNGRVTISWGNDYPNQLVQSINNHSGAMWIVGRRGIKVVTGGLSNFLTIEPDAGFVTWFVAGSAPTTDGVTGAYPFTDYPGPMVHLNYATGAFTRWDGAAWSAISIVGDGTITPVKLADGDFGDFTVSSGVATLDAGVVANSNLADAPAQSLKVNLTGSSASPTDAVVGDFTAGTAESGNLLLGWDAAGDLKKYSNVRLKAATDDHWEILPAEAF